MSADTHHAHDHGTMGQLMIGFALAAILTIIPFYLVMAEVDMARSTLVGIIMGLGAVQIVVHMIYFLHMNFHSEGGWNMLALIFTAVIVFIALAGSLWVMYHLNVNMMPGLMKEYG